MISRSVFAGVLAACLLSQPIHASDDLAQDWLDLWSRCRIAIETGTAFNAESLDDLGLKTQVRPPLMAGDLTLMRGYEYEERSWGRSGSEFVVRETERPAGDGKVTRGCDVQFPSDTHVLSDATFSAIVSTFTKERERLIELGEHEIRDPDQIGPMAVGVGPVSKNRNNCRVISFLMVGSPSKGENAPRYFLSASGEQTIEDGCGGPSLLKPED